MCENDIDFRMPISNRNKIYEIGAFYHIFFTSHNEKRKVQIILKTAKLEIGHNRIIRKPFLYPNNNIIQKITHMSMTRPLIAKRTPSNWGL